MRKITLLLLLVLLLLLGGCSSVIDISNTENLYRQGNFKAAYESLLAKQASIIQKQGSLIMDLDAGLLSRLYGNYQLSNEQLSSSERKIQEAYTESITANIASFIINDNTREYQGEAYEDIYINIFKALNYLHLGEEESALVELNRSLEKQSLLKQKFEIQMQKAAKYADDKGVKNVTEGTYSTSFSSSALANYLTMVVAKGLDEEGLSTYSLNQVRRSFQTQESLYPFAIPSSLDAEEVPAPEGKTRLNLLAFNGLAPQKYEAVDAVYVSRNNYAKIAYPVMAARKSPVQRVVVFLEDGSSFPLERLESLSLIAMETFKASSSLARMKAVIRSTLKALGVAVYDSVTNHEKTATAGEELLSWLFKLANYASESADVRSSHFLPSTAWVGSANLRPGEYTLKVAFQDQGGRTLYTQTIPKFKVEASGSNLAEAVCPL
ncbi:hypothetical protein [Sphaerochaeta sp. PS]|uniref:hypothetical protein n=1 Tax=Sphaerochaeta sp. PS TaxID=3076336 RepID=UPI0028A4D441|nr:hypothetical protein [Sphaerochaeta sp. PS]MDT4762102.1 hypothetical protein [Sphaerochaeta sp. PS]